MLNRYLMKAHAGSQGAGSSGGSRQTRTSSRTATRNNSTGRQAQSNSRTVGSRNGALRNNNGGRLARPNRGN